MMKSFQIIRNTLTVHNDLLEDHLITSFDKAAPHLSG